PVNVLPFRLSALGDARRQRMKRAAIYSSTSKLRGAAHGAPAAGAPSNAGPAPSTAGNAASPAPASGGRGAFFSRHGPFLLFVACSLSALALLLSYESTRPRQKEYTQEDIDAAVLNTLETQSLPSRPARAAESVLPSVVRVRGYVDDGGGELIEAATGS